MVFTLAFGQAFSFNWQIIAFTGATATFLLILFNHKKNINNYKTNVKEISK
jgi:ABC-type Fe3+-siderophore transport system permease subunit